MFEFFKKDIKKKLEKKLGNSAHVSLIPVSLSVDRRVAKSFRRYVYQVTFEKSNLIVYFSVRGKFISSILY